METFEYGPIQVDVEYSGEGAAPWGTKGETRHEYKVTARDGNTSHSSGAWGSIRDYEERDPEEEDLMRGMARLVIDDLSSAYFDPDEFIDMVVGELTGREALERGKEAEKIVEAAAKFGDVLEAAAEAARAEEEA